MKIHFSTPLFWIFAIVSLSMVSAAEKPNIIVILADDLGYGDVGCYGATDVATPHLDMMAKEGLKLTSFYVAPVCSPTRAALLTGCYSQRVGIGGVMFERNPNGLNHSEQTLPELLKEQGYASALVGKWHLGYRNDQHPPAHGFEYWYGTIASNNTKFLPANKTFAKDCVFREGLTRESAMNAEFLSCSLMRNDKIIEAPADQSQFTKRYTAEAIRFIEENKDQPFFLYLAHNMPHIPLHASEAFLGKSERGLYGDVIEELDWGIGQVLSALEEKGLDENTIVIFTSDNGPKREAGGSAGSLKGGKGSNFEGGTRVPCLVRWPGTIPKNKVIDEPAAIIDLAPTLVTLAGGAMPEDRVIDGKDLWPLLSGKTETSPHEAIYYLRGSGVAGVRVGNWKYILAKDPDQKAPDDKDLLSKVERKLPRAERKALLKQRRNSGENKKDPEPALYDLSTDPGEQQNQIEGHPEMAERLQQMMSRFRDELRSNVRPAGGGQ